MSWVNRQVIRRLLLFLLAIVLITLNVYVQAGPLRYHHNWYWLIKLSFLPRQYLHSMFLVRESLTVSKNPKTLWKVYSLPSSVKVDGVFPLSIYDLCGASWRSTGEQELRANNYGDAIQYSFRQNYQELPCIFEAEGQADFSAILSRVMSNNKRYFPEVIHGTHNSFGIISTYLSSFGVIQPSNDLIKKRSLFLQRGHDSLSRMISCYHYTLHSQEDIKERDSRLCSPKRLKGVN